MWLINYLATSCDERHIYPKNIHYLASLLRQPAKDLIVKKQMLFIWPTLIAHPNTLFLIHPHCKHKKTMHGSYTLLKITTLKKRKNKTVSHLPICVLIMKSFLLSMLYISEFGLEPELYLKVLFKTLFKLSILVFSYL